MGVRKTFRKYTLRNSCHVTRNVYPMAVRRVPVDQLVGATEIALRLGVNKSTVVHDWRYRYPEFPEPIASLAGGFIWAWPDVEKWAKATGRTIVENV
jgi:hypothetical protein